VSVDQAGYQGVPAQGDGLVCVDLRLCLCARRNGRDPAVFDGDAVSIEGTGNFDRNHPVGMYQKVCLHEYLPLSAISGLKYRKSPRRPY
jgi:hypothetical protein